MTDATSAPRTGVGAEPSGPVRAYLERIGVETPVARRPTLEALERLQRAHIAAVPFENLSIVGDPLGDYDGEPVSLALPDLYEKIVGRRRGGYCFELNGLFSWLLAELGYRVERLPARVTGDDATTRANHHAIAVRFDRRYLVDVGTGIPKPRRPVPFDEEVSADDTQWRVVQSDRPEADFRLQYRSLEEATWTDRFLFHDDPCDLDRFHAVNEHLQTAPESPFTADPIVNVATEGGYLRCSPSTLEIVTPDGTTEATLSEGLWHPILELYFGLRLPASTDPSP